MTKCRWKYQGEHIRVLGKNRIRRMTLGHSYKTDCGRVYYFEQKLTPEELKSALCPNCRKDIKEI
jgi:hypothetical protein